MDLSACENHTNPGGQFVALTKGFTYMATTLKDIRLASRRWKQINMILSQYAPQVKQGYAHIVRISGNNPFIAYAVINDGGSPGERTGDGAFIASAP